MSEKKMDLNSDSRPQQNSDDKFWVEDPCILFNICNIFPTQVMTKNQKLNALTRLILIIAVIMYFTDNSWWFCFFSVAILFVIVLKYNSFLNPVQENFTMTPTYNSPDFQQTVVSPSFAEEWQIIPPSFDLYTLLPPPQTFEKALKPQNYPFGQYLTKTNLLPSDEYYTHQMCGGQRQAREYANSSWLRHSLAFRDNMTRIYKKKLERRFRHTNVHDSYSPFSSY